MELGGGIFLGLILMFSLLAFEPNLSSLSFSLTNNQKAAIGSVETKEEKKAVFAIASSAFKNGGVIPARFTCDGENISPEIFVSNVPKEAQSLVVIMDDPDASGGTWTHWSVFNMPPTTKVLPEGKEPIGRDGINSWGKTGYGGPCPPKGEHRYFFRVYALNKTLPLKIGSSKEDILTAMKGSVLATAELIGRYKRELK